MKKSAKSKKTNSNTKSETQPRPLLIVGIGASAGGLEAFTKLLGSLPLDTGMAFVLLQHLDPTHDSMTTAILSRITKLSVTEVKEGVRAAPNCVYILPPNSSMGIAEGVLKLSPRSEAHGQHLVIDMFFKALAKDRGYSAIGVVLSGTGTDGTQGLTAIKAAGGITFAQLPKSAKFAGMPQSAIDSGSADFTLTPEEIAAELAAISRHPYVPRPDPKTEDEDPDAIHSGAECRKRIFRLLRTHCHVDFSLYKPSTVNRRIERRMTLMKMGTLEDYGKYLAQNIAEVKALYADILIHVTSFFRDPEAFDCLKKDVFPKLIENRSAGVPVRIWVSGCSSGEEAYSMAICLLEFLGDKSSHIPIQIFASDISEQAIQRARLGEYPESISHDVSDERLGRYFTRLENGGYKIAKAIRDICLFSRHDVTADPPFARMDLISCRNLLIYFSSALQKHVIPLFHYSLGPGGFLWLGKSETIGGFSDLFTLLDKTNKTYSRRNAPSAVRHRFPTSTFVQGKQEHVREHKIFAAPTLNTKEISERVLHEEYPGVLVNDDLEILELLGRTVPFLEPTSGLPQFNLMKMAHPDLIRDLRMSIQAVQKTNAAFRKEGLSIGEGRSRRAFNLNVIPVEGSGAAKGRLYLILFEKILATKVKVAQKSKKTSGPVKKDPYVLGLQQELSDTQDYQHSLIEKYETAQEDLTTLNEEMQSANEEMQSTNEELETAKEELQSGNEELTTVNDELQARSLEQSQTTNDLINLLGSVEIPIVMLSADRNVRRFTPLAGKALNLIATDIGRPLSDLKLNFTSTHHDLNLEDMVTKAMESLISQEVEVQDRKGRWFRLQVRPYKTVENKIDGAVLAFVDIDSLKLSLKEVKAARSEAERANRAKDLFLATLSHELRTPLSAILSWAQMLNSGKLDAARLKHGAEIIESSAKIQAQLINDLLDVSRIVSGKLSLETYELDPMAGILSAIEAIRPLAQAKSMVIETDFAGEVGSVLADPVRLQQVFWNLLSNAVKFSQPNSKVKVKLSRVEDRDYHKAKAVIEISDSGKGIAPEFLPQIFDRFSQQDESSIRLHGGLGLGLAIVRNLVELQGGTIRAESAGNGKGAKFTVSLPIKSNSVASTYHPPLARPPMAPKAADEVAVRLDGIRLLVVDDETNSREVFVELLRMYGAETQDADSAKEGFALFTEFKPDILISDIAMPGEDGYSLIQRIRALSPADGGLTPALAMTAYAGLDDVRRAMAAGFQAHVSKPVDGKHLAKTISRLAGKGQAE